jgi:putative salt-induced outer membrane protein YdiY
MLMAVSAPAWATKVNVTLRNGDVLNGELARQTEEALIIKHPVLGELTVPRSDVRAVAVGDAAVAKKVVKAEEKPVVRPPDDGLLGSGWLKDWDRRLEAGVSGAAGASNNQQGHVGFMADFENTEVRWKQRARMFRAESDGDETSNSATVSLTRDDLLPGSPWFRFAGGEFDQDKFQDWRNRLGLNGGVGYQFTATDRYRLLGRAGAGATYQWGGADGEEVAPELLLGFDMKWKISRQQSIALTNTFYPGLKEGSGYRNVSAFDWIIDLDKEAGLGLKIGVNNEHDSKPDDGGARNDFKYTSSLLWRL